MSTIDNHIAGLEYTVPSWVDAIARAPGAAWVPGTLASIDRQLDELEARLDRRAAARAAQHRPASSTDRDVRRRLAALSGYVDSTIDAWAATGPEAWRMAAWRKLLPPDPTLGRV